MGQKRISKARLETILRRQSANAWGRDYQPAIKATPQEAPRVSRPAIMESALVGRGIHVMSAPERSAALLALYHPRILDINEQRLLSTGPELHPLSGHPMARAIDLMPFQGTVPVAARLDRLAWHQKSTFPTADGADTVPVPIPYIGDLLLFLVDNDGGPYCVNWTVKKSPKDFTTNAINGQKPSRSQKRSNLKQEFRHELEEKYYLDAGIRTVRVTAAEIDDQVAANLNQLFGWHGRRLPLAPEQYTEISNHFLSLVGTRSLPFMSLPALAKRIGCTTHACRGVFYQDIWSRRLRVDLFSPVLIDRPLKKEEVDVIDAYADWFRR